MESTNKNEFDLKVIVGISAIVSLPVGLGIGISSILSSLVIVGMKVMKYLAIFSGSSLATTYTGEFSKHYRLLLGTKFVMGVILWIVGGCSQRQLIRVFNTNINQN